MGIEFTIRTGREIFGDHQFGFYPKLNRSLLKVTDYDYLWAEQNGLKVDRSYEVLVRVENSLTKIENGQIWMASIAKINLKTGSICFTEGEEGEEGFSWGSYRRAKITIVGPCSSKKIHGHCQGHCANQIHTLQWCRDFGSEKEWLLCDFCAEYLAYYDSSKPLLLR